MKINFDQDSFLNLISNVSVNGLIDSCVIKIDKKGVGVVDAIDMSNTVFIHCTEQLIKMERKGATIDAIEYGLPDLTKIITFLSRVKDVEFDIQEGAKDVLSSFVLSSKSFGKMKFRLYPDADSIPTAIKDEKGFEKLMAGYGKAVKFKISSEDIEKLQFYMGLVDSAGTLILKTDVKQNTVKVTNEEDATQHFEFKFGKIVSDNREAISISVYGSYFLSVLKSIFTKDKECSKDKEKDEKDCDVFLVIKEDRPVLFEKGDNVWAVVPIEK